METKVGVINAEIKTTDPAAGTFEAILSAPTLDRDGEIIDGRAFDPLPDHITIDIDHGMDVRNTVGSGVPRYDGDMLMFAGTFASTPLAQEVRTLVVEGHVRKMSVAFMHAVRETDPDDQRVHIRRAELLNAAIVPIPSNREASILVAKALDMAKTGARHSAADLAAIQSAHDALASLGAACKGAHPEATKSPTEDPEAAAAPAAAPPAPNVAKAMATLAEATLLLTT